MWAIRARELPFSGLRDRVRLRWLADLDGEERKRERERKVRPLRFVILFVTQDVCDVVSQ